MQIDREGYNFEKNKLMKDIETLNETIFTLNENLTTNNFKIEELQRKYDLELEKNLNLQKTLFTNNNNDHNNIINKNKINNNNNIIINHSNQAIVTNEISDETIEEMYQQQQIQQDFTLINGGNNNELLMATSVREKHELEIIKTIPIGNEMNVLQSELTRAKDQIKYYEEKANTYSSENVLLKNR